MNRLLTLFALLITSFSVWSETLSISRCVEMAKAHYPAIAQYGLLERVRQYNLSNAAKVWLPHGSVSAQATWQNTVAALPEPLTDFMAQQGLSYPGMDKFQYRAGIDINQQIWDGGMASANKRTIETSANVERTSLDVSIYDVQGRVEEIYFALLLLDARIERMEKSIVLVDSTLRQVNSMYANGVAMKSDCDQIEAKLLSLRQQQTQLSATRESYMRVMEIFIGQSIGDDTLILPPAEIDSDGDNPQLRLFDSRMKHLSSLEAEIRASTMPSFGAFASGYYGYPGYNIFENMKSHNPSFNLMIGVKASWNFGALYTRGNSLERLRVQKLQIESEKETYLFNRQIAENESQGQINALEKLLDNDERIVRLRHSVLVAAQSQLRNGVIDTTSFLTKITDEELAENEYELHNIELRKTIYQLNHIRNK